MTAIDAGPIEQHYSAVAEALSKGTLVALLGAGVNLCDPSRGQWQMGENLPDGSELSHYLAEKYYYPAEDSGDLLRVSQYAQAMRGPGTLYESLHAIFAASYRYTAVHEFLAEVPALTEATWGARRHQLIVTTNYDDALEQALTEASEPFELVWYSPPDERKRGALWHRPFEQEARQIRGPRKYQLPVGERTIVLKIHGAVSRIEGVADSYVISEDDYIKFLAETRLQDLIPAGLLSCLLNSHILFLGYSLRDWNLRVILQQIANLRDRQLDSWSIQREVRDIDRALWKDRMVNLYEVDLDSYVAGLREQISASRHDEAR